MDRFGELPPSVRGYLSDFATRWRRLVALRAIGTSLAVLTVWGLIACVADRLIHFSGPVRLASLAVAGLTAIAFGVIRLGRIRGPIDWVAMSGVIERHDPRFAQSLITVTSRILGSPEHRGSDEILSHLLREVEHRAAEQNLPRILSLRSAAGPWLVFLTAAMLIMGLSQVRGLGGPRLLARLVEPLGDIPPVTTTLLRVVSPRDANANVMQSEPLRIEVETQRLGTNPVLIYINDDGDTWAHYAMDDAGGGRFTYTISAVGRDLRYRITGGDASIGPFTVLVKRPPAVAEFRIRYTYPAYTGKAPVTVTNSDGTIDAPAGADALLTIVATEPLQAALLTIGDQKLLMEKTSNENIRQALLHVQTDTTYELDLISTRDVRGSGPRKMAIRAAADRPPLVRLLQSGQTLRVNPRDIVPLSYQAVDDYGLVAMSVIAQINADLPEQIPLVLPANRRRQEDIFNFDLALMKFRIGDVLTLSVSARDTAGKEAVSDEMRILICPRSIDLDARERTNELTAASSFAATLADELTAAAKAIEETSGQRDHQSAAYVSAEARVSRHLTTASEASTVLRQCLLRVCAHSNSAALSISLAGWADLVQQQTQTADDLFGRGGSADGIGAATRDRVQRAIDQAHGLFVEIRTVAQGERAAMVLADREDLQAAQSVVSPANPKAAERLTQTLQSVNDEVTAGAADLGVNAASPDAAIQLRKRIESGRAVVRGKQPLDFVAISHDWLQEFQRDPHPHTGLESRLATAAAAEAVRKDADLPTARDLELAARAAGAIEASIGQSPPGKSPLASAPAAFVNAMAALQRERAMKPASGRVTDEQRTIRNAANRARDDMARWAGEGNGGKNAAPVRPGDLEALALRASATSARREYRRAADEDRLFVQKLSDAARKPGGRAIEGDASAMATQLLDDRIQRIQHAADAVAHHLTAAENIDKLGQTQERLMQEARSSKASSRDLAARQTTLADQILDIERMAAMGAPPATGASRDVEDPNWRGRATEALLSVQESLTAMPQQLAAVLDADTAFRKASDAAGSARHDVASAPPARLAMANRLADQAEQDAREAANRLETVVAAVLPQAVLDLGDRVDPFSPEASGAHEIIVGPLASALTALQEAITGDDAGSVKLAAWDAGKAIDSAQKELVRTQAVFTQRDPLIAAKWFARAAADCFAHHPSDLRAALAHQASASKALSRAWDKSIHRAAEIRLSGLASLAAIYGPIPPSAREITTAAAFIPNTAAREWSRLHPRDGDDLTTTMHDADPPGFEEFLRLYFDALNKTQDKK